MKPQKVFLYGDLDRFRPISANGHRAVLFHYRNAQTNIIESTGDMTIGYLYRIPAEDLNRIDTMLGHQYRRCYEIITDFSNSSHTVWVYRKVR